MNYNYDTNKNLKEFIEYLDIENNSIPNRKSKAYFSDGTNMETFIRNHEMRIKYWLNSKAAINHPIAYKKLFDRFNELNKMRLKRKELIILREQALALEKDDIIKTKI